MMISAFLDALGADGPAADRAGKMDLYGRFIGSWDLDVMQIAEDGTKRRRKGEWHFGWALEGRAIQDVWIVPPRGELRHGDAAANVNSYGTTLRVYDPRIDAWQIQWTDEARQGSIERAVQDVWIVPPRGKLRSGDAAANVNSYGTTLRVYDPGTDAWLIQWTDPVTQNFLQMTGRADGSDIVQLGTRPGGKLLRWSFSEISENSFLWRGDISADKGASWQLNVEFTARRVAT